MVRSKIVYTLLLEDSVFEGDLLKQLMALIAGTGCSPKEEINNNSLVAWV